MKESSLPRAATVLPFAPVHQGQQVSSLSWAFSSHTIPFSSCCPFWWLLCPSHAPYLWLCLPSGHFFSCLCLLSLLLSTSAVNVFLLEAHFMLAFPRAWRTCFLGLPARWLLSLQILAVLDVSSLGDLLSLSPEQCCLLCHCSPPLLGHRTQQPLFLRRPVLQHIVSYLF